MVFRRVFWDRVVLFGACDYLIRLLAKTGRGLSARRQSALSHWHDHCDNRVQRAAERCARRSRSIECRRWSRVDRLSQEVDGLESPATGAALAAAALFIIGLCRASSLLDFARAKASSPAMSTISPHKPQDWPREFVENFNAGELDAVMSLYEPEARFVTRSSETLVGRDAIRRVLAGLIEAKTQFQSRVVRATIVGDIAQLYTDFEATRANDTGKTIPVRNRAIEVLRRQPDGSWKLIMGDPNGRE
jgi:uncharacterized protein (TIGR02246 family)